MSLLPFDQWVETEGASLSGLDQLQAYGDHYRLNAFEAGAPREDAELVDQQLTQLAVNRGYIEAETPEEAKQKFTTPTKRGLDDNDLRRIVDAKFYGKEEGLNEVRDYLAFKSLAAPDPEVLEERRKAAEPYLTPETAAHAKRAAVRRGDVPFTTYTDEEGRLRAEIGPDVADMTREEIAAAARSNPDMLRSTRDLLAVEQAFEIPDGYTEARHRVLRKGEIGAILSGPEATENRRAIIDSVAAYVEKGQEEDARAAARDLLNDQGLRSRFAEEDLVNAAMDLAKRRAAAEKPQILSTGEVVMPLRMLIRPDEHDAAVDRLNVSSAQKELAKKRRREALDRQAGIYHQIAADLGGSEYAGFYEEQKAAGKTDGEIIEAWFAEEGNYSGLEQRARGIFFGIMEGPLSLALLLPTLAGNEEARETMAGLVAHEEKRNRYAAMFGDNFEIGYDILRAAPAVAADIALAVPTGGAVGAASAGLRTSLRGLVAGSLRTSASATAKAAMQQAIKKGGKEAVEAALRGTGDDFAKKLGAWAQSSVAIAPTTFNRAAGMSYVDAYSTLEELHPDWSKEQIRQAALGHAVTAGAITVGIVSAFQGLAQAFPKVFGSGVEEWATPGQGMTVRQLNAAYREMVKSRKPLPPAMRNYINLESFETFTRDMAKLGTRNALVAYGRQAWSEGAEEAVDQFVSTFHDASLTGDNVNIVDAFKQSFHAAVVGGAFGLAGGVREVGVGKRGVRVTRSQQQAFETDAYTRLADGLEAFGDVASAAVLRTVVGEARASRTDVAAQLEDLATVAEVQELDTQVRTAPLARIPRTPRELQRRMTHAQDMLTLLEATPVSKRTLHHHKEIAATKLLLDKYASLHADAVTTDLDRPKPKGRDAATLQFGGYSVQDAGTDTPAAPEIPAFESEADAQAYLEPIDAEINRLQSRPSPTAYQSQRLNELTSQRDAVLDQFKEPAPEHEPGASGLPLEVQAERYSAALTKAEARIAELETRFPGGANRPPQIAVEISKLKAERKALNGKLAKLPDFGPETGTETFQRIDDLQIDALVDVTSLVEEEDSAYPPEERVRLLQQESAAATRPVPYTTVSLSPDGRSTVESTGVADIVNLAGRYIVFREVNGVVVPFYLSTGSGGKKNVQPGRWYPVFGFDPEGWINKTSEGLIDYWGSPSLRRMALALDAELGNQAFPDAPRVLARGNMTTAVANNLGVTPVSLGDKGGRAKVEANAAVVVERIESNSPQAKAATKAVAESAARKKARDKATVEKMKRGEKPTRSEAQSLNTVSVEEQIHEAFSPHIMGVAGQVMVDPDEDANSPFPEYNGDLRAIRGALLIDYMVGDGAAYAHGDLNERANELDFQFGDATPMDPLEDGATYAELTEQGIRFEQRIGSAVGEITIGWDPKAKAMRVLVGQVEVDPSELAENLKALFDKQAILRINRYVKELGKTGDPAVALTNTRDNFNFQQEPTEEELRAAQEVADPLSTITQEQQVAVDQSISSGAYPMVEAIREMYTLAWVRAKRSGRTVGEILRSMMAKESVRPKMAEHVAPLYNLQLKEGETVVWHAKKFFRVGPGYNQDAHKITGVKNGKLTFADRETDEALEFENESFSYENLTLTDENGEPRFLSPEDRAYYEELVDQGLTPLPAHVRAHGLMSGEWAYIRPFINTVEAEVRRRYPQDKPEPSDEIVYSASLDAASQGEEYVAYELAVRGRGGASRKLWRLRQLQDRESELRSELQKTPDQRRVEAVLEAQKAVADTYAEMDEVSVEFFDTVNVGLEELNELESELARLQAATTSALARTKRKTDVTPQTAKELGLKADVFTSPKGLAEVEAALAEATRKYYGLAANITPDREFPDAYANADTRRKLASEVQRLSRVRPRPGGLEARYQDLSRQLAAAEMVSNARATLATLRGLHTDMVRTDVDYDNLTKSQAEQVARAEAFADHVVKMRREVEAVITSYPMANMPGPARNYWTALRAQERALAALENSDYDTATLLRQLREVATLRRDVLRSVPGLRVEVDAGRGEAVSGKKRVQRHGKDQALKRHRRINSARAKKTKGNKTKNISIPFRVARLPMEDPETKEVQRDNEGNVYYHDERYTPYFTNDPEDVALALSMGFTVRVPREYRVGNSPKLNPLIKVNKKGVVTSVFDPHSRMEIADPGDLGGSNAERGFTPAQLRSRNQLEYVANLPAVPPRLYGAVGKTPDGVDPTLIEPSSRGASSDDPYISGASNFMTGVRGGQRAGRIDVARVRADVNEETESLLRPLLERLQRLEQVRDSRFLSRPAIEEEITKIEHEIKKAERRLATAEAALERANDARDKEEDAAQEALTAASRELEEARAAGADDASLTQLAAATRQARDAYQQIQQERTPAQTRARDRVARANRDIESWNEALATTKQALAAVDEASATLEEEAEGDVTEALRIEQSIDGLIQTLENEALRVQQEQATRLATLEAETNQRSNAAASEYLDGQVKELYEAAEAANGSADEARDIVLHLYKQNIREFALAMRLTELDNKGRNLVTWLEKNLDKTTAGHIKQWFRKRVSARRVTSAEFEGFLDTWGAEQGLDMRDVKASFRAWANKQSNPDKLAKGPLKQFITGTLAAPTRAERRVGAEDLSAKLVADSEAWVAEQATSTISDTQALAAFADMLLEKLDPAPNPKTGERPRTTWFSPKTGKSRPPSLREIIHNVTRTYIKAKGQQGRPLEFSIDDDYVGEDGSAVNEERLLEIAEAANASIGQSPAEQLIQAEGGRLELRKIGDRIFARHPGARRATEEVARLLGVANPEQLGDNELWERAAGAVLTNGAVLDALDAKTRDTLKKFHGRALRLAAEVRSEAEDAEQGATLAENKVEWQRFFGNLPGVEGGTLNPLQDGLRPAHVWQLVQHIRDNSRNAFHRQLAYQLTRPEAKVSMGSFPTIDFLSTLESLATPWRGAYDPATGRATLNLTQPQMDDPSDLIMRAVVMHFAAKASANAVPSKTTMGFALDQARREKNQQKVKLWDRVVRNVVQTFPDALTETKENQVRFAMMDPRAQRTLINKYPTFFRRLVDAVAASVNVDSDIGKTRLARFLNLFLNPTALTQNLVSPRTNVDETETVQAMVNRVTPGGVRVVEDESFDAPGWTTTSAPDTVFVNFPALERMVEGLAPDARETVVRAFVKHELAHLASMSSLTNEERLEVLRGLDQITLAKVRARASANANQLQLAEEAVRYLTEIAAYGKDSDRVLADLRDEAGGIMGLMRKYWRKFVDTLESLYPGSPDLHTAVLISKVERTLRKIERGAVPPQPLVTADVEEHMRLFDKALEQGSDQTFFMVPVSSTSDRVKNWIAEKTKRANAAKIGRDFAATVEFYRRAAAGMDEQLLVAIKAAEKRAAKAGRTIPPDAINDMLGSQEQYLTRGQIEYLDDAYKADLADPSLNRQEAATRHEARVAKEEQAAIQTRRDAARAAEATLRTIDPDLADTIVSFRTELDQIQRRAGKAYRGGTLSALFDRRTGVHLSRNYRMFSSAAWLKAALSGQDLPGRPDLNFAQMRHEASVELQEWFLREHGRPIADEKAMDMLDGWLAQLANTGLGDAGDFNAVVKNVASKDGVSFKTRSDIPAAMRRLMGEENSQVRNAVYTHTRLAKYLATHDMLTALSDRLTAGGMIFDRPVGPNGERLVPVLGRQFFDSSEYPELRGRYAEPAIAEALQSQMRTILPGSGPTEENLVKAVGGGLTRIAGASLGIKTLGSVGFYTRNEGSNSFYFLPMQGVWVDGPLGVFAHFGLGTSRSRHAARLSAGAQWASKVRDGDAATINRLTELGILHNDVRSEIIRDLFDIDRNPDSLLNEVSDWVDGKPPTPWIKKLIESKGKEGVKLLTKDLPEQLARINHHIDGKAKVILFEKELEVLKAVQKELGTTKSDAELEREAADKVLAVMQTHSHVYPPLRDFGRTPIALLVAPFARFKGEVVRITFNTFKLAFKEIADARTTGSNKLMQRGVNRLVSASFVMTGWTSIMVSLFAALFRALDRDDEEDEGTGFAPLTGEIGKTLRSALPTWQRNHTVFANVSDQSVTTIDMTYYNPLSLVSDPVFRGVDVMMTDGVDAAARTVIDYLATDFVGEGIASGALRQVLTNSDDYNERVWDSTDNIGQRAEKILNHLFQNAFEPGLISKGEQVLRAADLRQRAVDGDRTYDALQIIAGEITGVRPRKLDKSQLMFRSARNLKVEIDDLRRKLSVLTSPGFKEDEDLREAMDEYIPARVELYRQHVRNAETWAALNGPGGVAEYLKMMVEAGHSKARARQVILEQRVDREVRSLEGLKNMFDAAQTSGAEGGKLRVERYKARVLEDPRWHALTAEDR